jgi:simple sugar transport system substrate-binding protein
MQQENSPWTATAATDPAEVGRVQVRFAYQKIAGEETPNIYSLEPHLVEGSALPDQSIKMDSLSEYVPGWGTSAVATSPWMKTLETKGE